MCICPKKHTGCVKKNYTPLIKAVLSMRVNTRCVISFESVLYRHTGDLRMASQSLELFITNRACSGHIIRRNSKVTEEEGSNHRDTPYGAY